MSKIIKKKLVIEGMHCTSCAMNIDWDLEDLKGVKSAKTSYSSQECEVEFDQELVHSEQLIKAIETSGYKAQIKKD